LQYYLQVASLVHHGIGWDVIVGTEVRAMPLVEEPAHTTAGLCTGKMHIGGKSKWLANICTCPFLPPTINMSMLNQLVESN
jgi:hypothetical protein